MGYSTPIWLENAPFAPKCPFVHPNAKEKLKEPYWDDPQPLWHAPVDFRIARSNLEPTPKIVGYSILIWLENTPFALFCSFSHPKDYKKLNGPHWDDPQPP